MPHTIEVIGFGGVVERETRGGCGGGGVLELSLIVFWLSSFNAYTNQGCITCKTCGKYTLESRDSQLPFRFHDGRMHAELASMSLFCTFLFCGRKISSTS